MKAYDIENYDDIDPEILNEEVMIVINNIEYFADNAERVKDRMKRMSEQNILLRFVEFKCDVEPDFILSLFEIYEKLQRKELRERQYIGIKKALEMKKEGKGSYGRPKAELPDDFEEKVITCIIQGSFLSSYLKEINIPQSTFYKYANKIIRDQVYRRNDNEAIKK